MADLLVSSLRALQQQSFHFLMQKAAELETWHWYCLMRCWRHLTFWSTVSAWSSHLLANQIPRSIIAGRLSSVLPRCGLLNATATHFWASRPKRSSADFIYSTYTKPSILGSIFPRTTFSSDIPAALISPDYWNFWNQRTILRVLTVRWRVMMFCLLFAVVVSVEYLRRRNCHSRSPRSCPSWHVQDL